MDVGGRHRRGQHCPALRPADVVLPNGDSTARGRHAQIPASIRVGVRDARGAIYCNVADTGSIEAKALDIRRSRCRRAGGRDDGVSDYWTLVLHRDEHVMHAGGRHWRIERDVAFGPAHVVLPNGDSASTGGRTNIPASIGGGGRDAEGAVHWQVANVRSINSKARVIGRSGCWRRRVGRVSWDNWLPNYRTMLVLQGDEHVVDVGDRNRRAERGTVLGPADIVLPNGDSAPRGRHTQIPASISVGVSDARGAVK